MYRYKWCVILVLVQTKLNLDDQSVTTGVQVTQQRGTDQIAHGAIVTIKLADNADIIKTRLQTVR